MAEATALQQHTLTSACPPPSPSRSAPCVELANTTAQHIRPLVSNGRTRIKDPISNAEAVELAKVASPLVRTPTTYPPHS